MLRRKGSKETTTTDTTARKTGSKESSDRAASSGGGANNTDSDKPILSPTLGRMSRAIQRISRRNINSATTTTTTTKDGVSAGTTLANSTRSMPIPRDNNNNNSSDEDDEDSSNRKTRTQSLRIPQVKRFPLRLLQTPDDSVVAQAEHISLRPIRLIALVELLECGIEVLDDQDNIVRVYKFEDGMTMEDVVQKMIKPSTSFCKCALINALENTLERDGPMRGHYVVAPRSLPYRDVLKALLQKFTPETYCWIDIFCANQHTWNSLPVAQRKWIESGLHDTLGRFEGRVVVIDGWDNPTYLTRTWAIWEVFGFVLSGYAFSFLMEESKRVALCNELFEKTDARLINYLTSLTSFINVGSSQCSDPIDHKLIMTHIQDSVGESKVNKIMRERLVRWLLTTANQFLEDARTEQNKKREYLLLRSVCVLQMELGDVAAALKMRKAALAVAENVFGKSTAEVASLLEDLARGSIMLGFYKEALAYRERLLSIEMKLYGMDHHNVATDYNNLGRILEMLGEFEAASTKYATALTTFKKLDGIKSPAVATTLNNFGASLQSQGKFNDAEKAFREAWEIWVEIRGDPTDGDTITARAWLADVLQSQQKFQEALPILEEIWELRKKTFGNNHPDTVTALSNLVCCLEDGKLGDESRRVALGNELEELDKQLQETPRMSTAPRRKTVMPNGGGSKSGSILGLAKKDGV
jgi:tetratricopeptide (TPR) repeat protein